MDLVTKSTCELSWRAPFHAGSLSYRVCYWRDGQTPSFAREVDVRETGCRLQELQPNTTYSVSVVAPFHLTVHANQPYKWEYVSEQQATSSDAIKQKYEAFRLRRGN
jgi:hypothetical protein